MNNKNVPIKTSYLSIIIYLFILEVTFDFKKMLEGSNLPEVDDNECHSCAETKKKKGKGGLI